MLIAGYASCSKKLAWLGRCRYFYIIPPIIRSLTRRWVGRVGMLQLSGAAQSVQRRNHALLHGRAQTPSNWISSTGEVRRRKPESCRTARSQFAAKWATCPRAFGDSDAFRDGVGVVVGSLKTLESFGSDILVCAARRDRIPPAICNQENSKASSAVGLLSGRKASNCLTKSQLASDLPTALPQGSSGSCPIRVATRLSIGVCRWKAGVRKSSK
mmetsp:Transcript_65427/g.156291  ORF Transcript_65427/g.156291 Transcript_65427/m.156291 type:complete len:214 (-) Transcript_65427:546-1187(-)